MALVNTMLSNSASLSVSLLLAQKVPIVKNFVSLCSCPTLGVQMFHCSFFVVRINNSKLTEIFVV